MFVDTRSIYGRPVYELCDLKIRHWKIAELSRFRCPANVGRSLKIAAEPAVIEQTIMAVILAKMRFLARREVGRAPFWICDGPLTTWACA